MAMNLSDIHLGRWLDLQDSQNKIYITSGRLAVRQVRDIAELWKLLALRYEVFSREYNLSPRWPAIDFDQFDLQCFHLVVEDIQSGEIVGTYRINFGGPFGFYSETEFYLDKFLALNGRKMELGRAAVKEDYRNGVTIDLLWRGIAELANRKSIRYLFGTSSVSEANPLKSEILKEYVIEEKLDVSQELGIVPKLEIENRLRELNLPPNVHGIAKEIMPSLLRSYFSAGAKVSARSYYDKDFDCLDFFTVLDLDNVTPSFKRRYFKKVG